MGRGADADAGGAADLQTDVMRFMAIISMCLVAIFALVQSIPPAPVGAPDIVPAEPMPAAQAVSAPEPAGAATLTRPAPPQPVQKAPPVRLERPAPPTVSRSRPEPAARVTEADRAPTRAAPPAPAPAGKIQDGFSLRFESDDALKRLVARDVVGLYAISPNGVQRMNVDGDRLNFWNASLPQRFHEMDVATVPTEVLTAYGRSGVADGIRWGVSLPPAMSQQLNDFLDELDGGALIIGRDGRLRVEP
jgi:hypothetical protein